MCMLRARGERERETTDFFSYECYFPDVGFKRFCTDFASEKFTKTPIVVVRIVRFLTLPRKKNIIIYKLVSRRREIILR